MSAKTNHTQVLGHLLGDDLIDNQSLAEGGAELAYGGDWACLASFRKQSSRGEESKTLHHHTLWKKPTRIITKTNLAVEADNKSLSHSRARLTHETKTQFLYHSSTSP